MTNNFMKKLIPLLNVFIILPLCQCANTPKADMKKFSKLISKRYPPITLYHNGRQSEVGRFRETPFLDALVESKVFESVSLRNPFATYSMEVNIETVHEERYATGVPLVQPSFLSAVTLGVVPSQHTYKTTGIVNIRKHKKTIESIPIDLTFDSTFTTVSLNSNSLGERGPQRQAAEYVISELIRRKTFE